MNDKWSSQQTLEFVEVYKQHQCLWDPGHPQYKDRASRDSALSNIAEHFRPRFSEFDLKCARKKIKIIRSTYWNEKTKIEKSRSGGVEGTYKPKLSWFYTADQFLGSSSYWRESQLNLDLKQEAEEPTDEIPQISRQIIEPEPEQPRKKRRKNDDSLDTAVKAQQELSGNSKEAAIKQQEQQENEFVSFGRSVATQLQQLPLDAAIELEMQIQALISVRRLQLLRPDHVDSGPD